MGGGGRGLDPIEESGYAASRACSAADWPTASWPSTRTATIGALYASGDEGITISHWALTCRLPDTLGACTRR